MRNRKNLGAGDETTDINISPLIDMVFILLIFFIVTTVFVDEAGLEANTPEPNNQPPPEDPVEPVIFRIAANREITEGGRVITVRDVTGIVARAMREKEQAVTIETEPSVPMETVIRVMDAATSGEAPQVVMKEIRR